MNNSSKAQAILIVIAFLAVFFIVGTAFFLLSQAERVGAVGNANSVRARYVAEAGVEYARKVLLVDRNQKGPDTLNDISFANFRGSEVDVNEDGTPEARRFDIRDSDGQIFGRFAIRVTDEAGKLNVNVCSRDELAKLLSLRGIAPAQADEICAARPFAAVEELSALLGTDGFKAARDYLTVYSRDRECDLNLDRRVYLNTANPQLVVDKFIARGIEGARQKAAMLIDAADTDVSRTVMSEFSADNLAPSGLSDPGDWKLNGPCYEAPVNGVRGIFTWSNIALEDGAYSCYVYGLESGDVVGSIDGVPVRSGDMLAQPVVLAGGAFSITITPAADVPSRFSHVQLSRAAPGGSLKQKVYCAAEALAINELMPALSRDAGVGISDLSPGGMAEKVIPTDLRPGFYTLQVFSGAAGGFVGDVSIQGKSASGMYTGDFMPSGIEVGSTGIVSIRVKNNDNVKHASLSSVRLSQQPDCEYIEILNLSGAPIDIGNFICEVYTSGGEMVAGWPARIPPGTVIDSFEHMALSVDAADTGVTPVKLRNNGVSFRRRWGLSSTGLDFEGYAGRIDGSFDLLPDSGGRVILKNAYGVPVDAVEYRALQVTPFTGIERSDPAARIDDDFDGFLDGWYACTAAGGGTPCAANDNLGMYTTRDNEIVRHTPAEITFFNRPLTDLSEAVRLSSGAEWEKFSLGDIARICDVFACDAHVLALSGHYSGGAFTETGGVFHSTGVNDAGSWEFQHIPAGEYWLSIQGVNAESSSISVSVACGAGVDFGPSSSLMFTGNRAHYGKVTLIAEKEGTLRVMIVNDSGGDTAVTAVILEPVLYAPGRVNVNTAQPEVLRSIFTSDEMVQAVVQARPLGAQSGVGDLFFLDEKFLALHKKLTVKSDTYEIQSRGEAVMNGKPSAVSDIRVILERGS